jgi:hypothetical protein
LLIFVNSGLIIFFAPHGILSILHLLVNLINLKIGASFLVFEDFIFVFSLFNFSLDGFKLTILVALSILNLADLLLNVPPRLLFLF